jgi:hypothetical protein
MFNIIKIEKEDGFLEFLVVDMITGATVSTHETYEEALNKAQALR